MTDKKKLMLIYKQAKIIDKQGEEIKKLKTMIVNLKGLEKLMDNKEK